MLCNRHNSEARIKPSNKRRRFFIFLYRVYQIFIFMRYTVINKTNEVII